jgi:hypothetical protein
MTPASGFAVLRVAPIRRAIVSPRVVVLARGVEAIGDGGGR